MTWNPTTGCNKLTAGCKFCYAEVMSRRLKAMGQEKYKNGFRLTIHPESLETPYEWEKPKTVFVNSMSDLFHKDIPLSFIKKVFNVMNDTPQQWNSNGFGILKDNARKRMYCFSSNNGADRNSMSILMILQLMLNILNMPKADASYTDTVSVIVQCAFRLLGYNSYSIGIILKKFLDYFILSNGIKRKSLQANACCNGDPLNQHLPRHFLRNFQSHHFQNCRRKIG